MSHIEYPANRVISVMAHIGSLSPLTRREEGKLLKAVELALGEICTAREAKNSPT